MYYTIRFKTYKQMAYAFSLPDYEKGSRFYYSKAIVFDDSMRHFADYFWSFLEQMSDDPAEDFTLNGCSFIESEVLL